MSGAVGSFFLGVTLLIALLSLGRAARERLRRVERAWSEVEAALSVRGARVGELARLARAALPEQGRLLGELADAAGRAGAAPARPARVDAEQEVSLHLSRLLAAAKAHLPALPPSPTAEELSAELKEAEERERFIAEARERYNEEADGLNVCRRAFPLGLALRALSAEPAPLFQPVRPTSDTRP